MSNEDNGPITLRGEQLRPTSKYRVLLIEDSELHTRIIERTFDLFLRDRCELRATNSLGAAIAMIQSGLDGAFNAVLLDLGLGETSGMETFRVFREHFPTMPTIVLTADDSDVIRDALMTAGAYDVLHKGGDDGSGVSADQIFTAIDDAVRGAGSYSRTATDVEVIRTPAAVLREYRDTRDEVVRTRSIPPKGASVGELERFLGEQFTALKAGLVSNMDMTAEALASLKNQVTEANRTARQTMDSVSELDERHVAAMAQIDADRKVAEEARDKAIAEQVEAQHALEKWKHEANWKKATKMVLAVTTVIGIYTAGDRVGDPVAATLMILKHFFGGG